MEAPKEIYLNTPDGDYNVATLDTKTFDGHNTKYIRADLAELTWEDVKKIVLIAIGLDNQYRNYPWRDDEAFYEEVLRRFNEQRKK